LGACPWRRRRQLWRSALARAGLAGWQVLDQGRHPGIDQLALQAGGVAERVDPHRDGAVGISIHGPGLARPSAAERDGAGDRDRRRRAAREGEERPTAEGPSGRRGALAHWREPGPIGDDLAKLAQQALLESA
jgi:hypothetical protein